MSNETIEISISQIKKFRQHRVKNNLVQVSYSLQRNCCLMVWSILCVFVGVRRPQVPPDVGVPQWLPLCTTNGQVYHTLLSPQCWPARQHLSGHPQGEVVSSLRCPHDPSVHTKSSRRYVSCPGSPVTYDFYNSIHISHPSDIGSLQPYTIHVCLTWSCVLFGSVQYMSLCVCRI